MFRKLYLNRQTVLFTHVHRSCFPIPSSLAEGFYVNCLLGALVSNSSHTQGTYTQARTLCTTIFKYCGFHSYSLSRDYHPWTPVKLAHLASLLMTDSTIAPWRLGACAQDISFDSFIGLLSFWGNFPTCLCGSCLNNFRIIICFEACYSL